MMEPELHHNHSLLEPALHMVLELELHKVLVPQLHMVLEQVRHSHNRHQRMPYDLATC
jgi:hypothetical protein